MRVWLRKFQQVSIRTKLLVPFFVLSVGPALLVGLVSILVVRQALAERIHRQLVVRGDHLAVRGEMILDSVRADLRFLLNLSSVAALASCDKVSDGNAWSEQRTHVERDFLVFSTGRRAYYQVRYLDRTGREVVRLNCKEGVSETVPPEQLQEKSDRYYYVDTAALPHGQIYVSKLDLNVEEGRIEEPHRLVLRYAAPVHAGSRLAGVIVINVYADYFAEILRTPGGDYEVTLLDADGAYILYSGTHAEKASRRVYGNGARVQDELIDAWPETIGVTSERSRLRDRPPARR